MPYTLGLSEELRQSDDGLGRRGQTGNGDGELLATPVGWNGEVSRALYKL